MPTSPRMIFELQGGMNTLEAPDLLKPGSYAYLQNVRRLLGGRIVGRFPLAGNLLSAPLPEPVQSVTRMNDPYIGSPGFAYIEGANDSLYVGNTQVASGLSGNPLSFLQFRPPATPQPWCYVGDPSLTVSILNPSYAGYTGPLCGMLKVRSDGTCYKTGVMEPQIAPGVSSPGGGPNQIVYRYTYRDSKTGAVSNPSPESTPVQNGSSFTVVVAGVSNFNPVQYQNYTNSGSGGVMNNQWTSAYGGFNQFETLGSLSGASRTLQPIQTENMSYSSEPGSSPFPVPTGVTITGIQFQLNWLNAPNEVAGTLLSCQLAYQGQLIGTQKQPGINSTSTDPGAGFGAGNLIGNDGDTWGATLSPAIVNDPTFGINFVLQQGQSTGSGNQLFIDVVYVVIYWSTVNATVTPTASTDPQVDVNDIYRMGGALENFTYVGTMPNGTAFTDTLGDGAAALNPILEFDNYEPFPSIDLPRSGVVNVGANGILTWVSGDQFNLRWLPGTLVLVAGVAYVLYNRPLSAVQMLVYTSTVSDGTITFGYPPTGSNIAYSIAEPDIAAEPSPVIWGPTPDNAGSFYFGADPLNPGFLVWSKGNNFDSAPDTNRLEMCSPSEMLMNGTVTSELTTVFSTERFWLIYPNFADAVAAVTGTLGQQWVPVQAAATRGLYMRYAIAALGSMIAWRAKDGIFISQGGGPEQEISGPIYNLFPHGDPEAPQPVVVGNYTVYPPDDTKPSAQTMTLVPGYLFYDYQDVNGDPRTLVYDVEAKGWSVDVSTPVGVCHALPVADNQILLGCQDGTVRAFDAAGTEAGLVVVGTPSVNGGNPRTVKRIGGVFVRALAASAITPFVWANRYTSELSGFTPNAFGIGASEADYLIDFTQATGADVLDLAVLFNFGLGSGDWLKEWQIDWTEIPAQIAAWRTGMLAFGLDGWLFSPWLRFSYASTVPINLTIITDQGATIATVIPSSGGNPAKYFSWLPSIVNGISTKYRMLEFIADTGGTPWTCYAAEIELPIRQWGEAGPFRILRPFSGAGFGVRESTT